MSRRSSREDQILVGMALILVGLLGIFVVLLVMAPWWVAVALLLGCVISLGKAMATAA